MSRNRSSRENFIAHEMKAHREQLASDIDIQSFERIYELKVELDNLIKLCNTPMTDADIATFAMHHVELAVRMMTDTANYSETKNLLDEILSRMTKELYG